MNLFFLLKIISTPNKISTAMLKLSLIADVSRPKAAL